MSQRQNYLHRRNIGPAQEVDRTARTNKARAYSEWLVVRGQQGDREAINSLIEHWQERYFHYARRRLENREAARDVTQETLVSVCRNLRSLKDPATYPSWSYRILERRCIDWLRKSIREREVVETMDEPPELAVGENNDAGRGFEQILAAVSPELQSLLQLYYLEELTINEISRIIAIPPGTVKSRLFYARKMLAEKFGEE